MTGAPDPPQERTSMTHKELKRLRRSDLMEMLLELSKENLRLQEELQEANRKLEEREIAIAECGSLAEAALKLNRIFEDAQAACDQYRYNLMLRSGQTEPARKQPGKPGKNAKKRRRK